MSLPVLYSFRRCPYAMRARHTLLVTGQAVELREVVLRDKPPELLAASAKGTVPVLVLPDGAVLEESLDIMDWALARADPEGWLPTEPEDIATSDAHCPLAALTHNRFRANTIRAADRGSATSPQPVRNYSSIVRPLPPPRQPHVTVPDLARAASALPPLG